MIVSPRVRGALGSLRLLGKIFFSRIRSNPLEVFGVLPSSGKKVRSNMFDPFEALISSLGNRSELESGTTISCMVAMQT